jgi:hypothetical protein
VEDDDVAGVLSTVKSVWTGDGVGIMFSLSTEEESKGEGGGSL